MMPDRIGVFFDTRKAILFSGLGMVLVLAAQPSWSQVGVDVSSSLDQTAAVTSRGAKGAVIGPAAAVTAIPEGLEKLPLAPGFVLHLSVFNVMEMTQDVRVDDTGDASIPLIGKIHLAGDTLPVAERTIEKALVEKQILVTPQVTLTVAAFPQSPVVVAGEVQLPGKVMILTSEPVLDLIAAAGGVTTAAGGDIEIDHHTAGQADTIQHIPYANGKEPDDARHALVYPGDSVYVRRAGVIYVLGAVNRPGGYLMVNGGTLTLPQAIALASGTTVVAAASTAVVVRKNGQNIVQLQVALKKESQGQEEPFWLQEGDMVYIPTSKIKAALVNSSTVLSAAASASVYSVINR